MVEKGSPKVFIYIPILIRYLVPHSKNKSFFTEAVSRGRTFEVSYGSTKPENVSHEVCRIPFKFGRSVQNLKGSSPGYSFGKKSMLF